MRLSFLAALLLQLAALGSSEAQVCAQPPGPPITNFSIVLPLSPGQARSLVLRAFARTNHPVMTSDPASLAWSTGDMRDQSGNSWNRTIGARLTPVTSGTQVVLMAEQVVHWNSGRVLNDTLSQKNGGYGFYVWCATKKMADSLTIWTAPDTTGVVRPSQSDDDSLN